MTGLSILYNGTGHSIGASYPPDSTHTPTATAASLLGIDGPPGITTHPTQVSEYGGHSVPSQKVSSVTSLKTEPADNEHHPGEADQQHKGNQEEGNETRHNEDGPVSQEDKRHPLGNGAVNVVLTGRTLQVCGACLREPRWGVCADCGFTAACLLKSYRNP
jgi:hypothetical protein